MIGPIGPTQDGVDQPFWEGLAQGELRIQRCAKCERWIWAPQWRCAECGSWDMNWRATPARGTVYSWTRTWHPFSPEMRDVLPYLVVLVELPEAGAVRLAGLLADVHALAIGDAVEGVIQPPSERTSNQAVLRWRRIAA